MPLPLPLAMPRRCMQQTSDRARASIHRYARRQCGGPGVDHGPAPCWSGNHVRAWSITRPSSPSGPSARRPTGWRSRSSWSCRSGSNRIVGRHVPVGAVVEQAAALHEPSVRCCAPRGTCSSPVSCTIDPQFSTFRRFCRRHLRSGPIGNHVPTGNWGRFPARRCVTKRASVLNRLKRLLDDEEGGHSQPLPILQP